MALLRKLNEKATEAAVRDFFESEFKHIKAQARINHVDLKSPVISDMPGGPKNGNSVEEKLTNHMQAKVYMEQVRQAINAMPKPEKYFFKYRYIDDMEWIDISELMNMTPRTGQKYIGRALRYFADAFADVHDFRVFYADDLEC
ncbi:ArpU family phage packaging/lysis transcriptional regulator [Weissella cibaria]|uniref:ArpU family phage packaging/lysis transcriptional regulator n=1 Tax=Weissella cibaria TaxID=137591 RepID=UPI0013DB6A7D|nr:ArpU family phage packaging/lysis transcriptional regulator [Weissella cibaria]NFA01999.1 ArpU family transcriptional regulator [Weissella cibaria]